METNEYGYQIPETNDLAPTWMAALEANWERISEHTHDGTDSPNLALDAISKPSSTISGASWGSDLGGGRYKQTITVPAAILEINDYDVHVYITSTGERIYPTIVRASATTYDIYSTNNSLALTVRYA